MTSDFIKEDERIRKMVQSNPKKYVSEHLATNKSHWIWHQVGQYFGQYDAEDGWLLTRCHCVKCNWDNLGIKRLQNDHCIYCYCKDCVCEARAVRGYYSDIVLKPFWDNPCMGTCDKCLDK